MYNLLLKMNKEINASVVGIRSFLAFEQYRATRGADIIPVIKVIANLFGYVQQLYITGNSKTYLTPAMKVSFSYRMEISKMKKLLAAFLLLRLCEFIRILEVPTKNAEGR